MSSGRRSKSITSRNSTIDEFCFSSETVSTRASSIHVDSSNSSATGCSSHRHSVAVSAGVEEDLPKRPFLHGLPTAAKSILTFN